MSKNNLLQIPSHAVSDIKKLYNLDGPGRMEEAIEILEKWIQQENHIIKKDFKTGYLEWTLIAAKGSVEKAKKRIDALCTMKTLIPNFYTINNSKVQFMEMSKLLTLVPLPNPTDDLYRIAIFKLCNGEYTQQLIFLFFQYCILIADYLCQRDYVKGFIIVDDFREGSLFDFLTKLSTTHLQQCMSIATKGYGTRLKAIHVVSQSKAVELFSTIMRQVGSAKIADRIRVYKTIEELKDLPLDNFPEEYGGKERSLSTLNNEWIETIFSEEVMDNFKLMSAARTDERFRLPEKFNTEYMGMPGSFRNLTVD